MSKLTKHWLSFRCTLWCMCWVFEYWLHCCQNKYSCMMLDTMFQHLGIVQCALFMWLGLRNLYLIKEIIPCFLFTKNRIFVLNQLGDLFLKYRQYFRIPWWCVWRFLKMFILFLSYHICFWSVTWDSMNILFTWLVFPEEIYFSDGYFYLLNIFSKEILENIFLKNICFNIFLKRIFDTNICKYISKEYLFKYISKKNIWYKYMEIYF